MFFGKYHSYIYIIILYCRRLSSCVGWERERAMRVCVSKYTEDLTIGAHHKIVKCRRDSAVGCRLYILCVLSRIFPSADLRIMFEKVVYIGAHVTLDRYSLELYSYTSVIVYTTLWRIRWVRCEKKTGLRHVRVIKLPVINTKNERKKIQVEERRSFLATFSRKNKRLYTRVYKLSRLFIWYSANVVALFYLMFFFFEKTI